MAKEVAVSTSGFSFLRLREGMSSVRGGGFLQGSESSIKSWPAMKGVGDLK